MESGPPSVKRRGKGKGPAALPRIRKAARCFQLPGTPRLLGRAAAHTSAACPTCACTGRRHPCVALAVPLAQACAVKFPGSGRAACSLDGESRLGTGSTASDCALRITGLRCRDRVGSGFLFPVPTYLCLKKEKPADAPHRVPAQSTPKRQAAERSWSRRHGARASRRGRAGRGLRAPRSWEARAAAATLRRGPFLQRSRRCSSGPASLHPRPPTLFLHPRPFLSFFFF